jgi:hypothetical protein
MAVGAVWDYCPAAFAVIFGWRGGRRDCGDMACVPSRVSSEEGKPMKVVAIALVALFIAGCASMPTASVPTDRPDLAYKSMSACVAAGREWNGTSGVCM